MPTAALVLPILPYREEQWRRFAQDLLGESLPAYEDLVNRLGIGGMRAYLVRTCGREVIVAYVQADEPEKAFRMFAASEAPFELWMKEKLADLHGCDLGRRPTGPPPELVFEYPEAGAEGGE